MKSISSPSEKLPDAKRKSSSETSKTDWARLKTMKDEDIDLTADHPEADIAHIHKGIVRHGLRPAPHKTSVSLRIDTDVLEWFKSQGPGYQVKMNAVLKAFRDASL
jgi:uncharacterized protein (DUF4415 family)